MMSEFRDIENQLRSLSPKDPPVHLTKRIEQGLGEAGNLAVRRFPEENKASADEKKIYDFAPYRFGLGLAASLLFVFIGYQLFNGELTVNQSTDAPNHAKVTFPVIEDPESPIHGVSVAELEQMSGMPVGGWTPIFQERLLDRIDEGVVSRPSGTPARQVRMQYLDQILWQHPATETRMISTKPRQEIILIDLDLY